MTIVATKVLAALLRTNRVWLVAGRSELTSMTPVAPVHTTRPHTTTAAVTAGAWTWLRTVRSAVSIASLIAAPRAALVEAVLASRSGTDPAAHLSRGA